MAIFTDYGTGHSIIDNSSVEAYEGLPFRNEFEAKALLYQLEDEYDFDKLKKTSGQITYLTHTERIISYYFFIKTISHKYKEQLDDSLGAFIQSCVSNLLGYLSNYINETDHNIYKNTTLKFILDNLKSDQDSIRLYVSNINDKSKNLPEVLCYLYNISSSEDLKKEIKSLILYQMDFKHSNAFIKTSFSPETLNAMFEDTVEHFKDCYFTE